MIQNTKELYEKMCGTSELCGSFELIDNMIVWDLFDGFTIKISIEPPSTFFSIEKKWFWGITNSITDWHPDEEEVFEQVCKIGFKGNVWVIRKNLLYTSTIYMGKEENCPYSPKKRWSRGRIYYLQAT